DFLDGEQSGHIDLKKARAGSFAGGLFALYSPSPRAANTTEPSVGAFSRPLPPPLPMDEARASVVGELAMLVKVERASQGAVASSCVADRRSL
ncbi:MAG: peptidase, partial [Proteobacteria bacterium]|nr:peptidase [Pseudomonadota bacterium]